jgi:uncharacterized UPF0146 family protein
MNRSRVDIDAKIEAKLIIVTLTGATDDIAISFKLTKTEGRRLLDVLRNLVMEVEA